jgi:hypothetical protein
MIALKGFKTVLCAHVGVPEHTLLKIEKKGHKIGYRCREPLRVEETLMGAAMQEKSIEHKTAKLSGSSYPVKSDGVPIPGMIALKGF